MILVSSTGEMRFWESMSLALANVERYKSLKLDMSEDSFADKIWKVDVSIFTCRVFPPQARSLMHWNG